MIKVFRKLIIPILVVTMIFGSNITALAGINGIKDNANNLAQYIATYGSETTSETTGKKYKKIEKKDGETARTYITYRDDIERLLFRFSFSNDGFTVYIEFDYDLESNNTISPMVVNLTGKEFGQYIDASAEDFDIETYTEDTILKFKVKDFFGNDISDNNTQEQLNGFAKGAVAIWDDFLMSTAKIHLKDIGFLAYPDGIRDKDSQVFRAGFDTAVSKTYGDAAFGNKTASLTTGNGRISYSSSDPAVAAVDANTGRVTIAGAGTATITATAAETADYAATSVSYTLTVAPKSIAKPAAVTSSFTYNGQEQTYNVRTSGDYTVTGNKATAAGNHTVTVALNDKANTAWADGTTSDITFDFVIAKASVTVTAKDKTVYIGGTVPALPETPAANTDYTVTGLAAGDTLASVALKYQKDGQDVADATTISTSEAAVYDIVITAALADETNYNTPITLKNGKLTIRTKPSGGGGHGGGGGGNAASQTPAENKPNEMTSEAGIKTAPDFADVPAGHWAKDAVNYVCTNGLFQGISANAFGPDVAMSRGMLVTVLWRLDGRSASGAAVFSDVDSDAYYFEAVAWANANGIVKGIDDTHFAPNSNITREQMAVILERYAELKGYKADSTAADISAFADREQVSAYALDGVAWANAAGLMNGRTETTLVPKGETTRAEVAAIVQRFAQNVVK